MRVGPSRSAQSPTSFRAARIVLRFQAAARAPGGPPIDAGQALVQVDRAVASGSCASARRRSWWASGFGTGGHHGRVSDHLRARVCRPDIRNRHAGHLPSRTVPRRRALLTRGNAHQDDGRRSPSIYRHSERLIAQPMRDVQQPCNPEPASRRPQATVTSTQDRDCTPQPRARLRRRPRGAGANWCCTFVARDRFRLSGSRAHDARRRWSCQYSGSSGMVCR